MTESENEFTNTITKTKHPYQSCVSCAQLAILCQLCQLAILCQLRQLAILCQLRPVLLQESFYTVTCHTNLEWGKVEEEKDRGRGEWRRGEEERARGENGR